MSGKATSSRPVYRGRAAKQAGSRARRNAILRAALRIIARDGIRAVRHRAVATEARVPLAATTYYFKDINDLIHDAFVLYSEDMGRLNRKLELKAFSALEMLTPEQRRDDSRREELVTALTDFVVTHISDQVSQRKYRILEHAFRLGALHDQRLARLVAANRASQLKTIERFFLVADSPDPVADATCLHAAILYLEYQMLTHSAQQEPLPDLHEPVRRLLDKLLFSE